MLFIAYGQGCLTCGDPVFAVSRCALWISNDVQAPLVSPPWWRSLLERSPRRRRCSLGLPAVVALVAPEVSPPASLLQRSPLVDGRCGARCSRGLPAGVRAFAAGVETRLDGFRTDHCDQSARAPRQVPSSWYSKVAPAAFPGNSSLCEQVRRDRRRRSLSRSRQQASGDPARVVDENTRSCLSQASASGALVWTAKVRCATCKNCFLGAGVRVLRHRGRLRQDSGNPRHLLLRALGCEGKEVYHGARDCPNREPLERKMRRRVR